MNTTTKVVQLTLNTNEFVAREVAEDVFFRINPHQSVLTEERLNSKGIDVESLQRYFTELSIAVNQFWQNCWDPRAELTLKPHEMRSLYLPTMYAVILAAVGNFKIGNYEYRLVTEKKPDRMFLLEFSAKLESMRDVIRGDIGQIGNRSAQPQQAVMSCLMGEISSDGREGELLVRDGVTVDVALAGHAALVGLSLVETAYTIMYTGLETVNFRQLMSTVKEKESGTF